MNQKFEKSGRNQQKDNSGVKISKRHEMRVVNKKLFSIRFSWWLFWAFCAKEMYDDEEDGNQKAESDVLKSGSSR